MTARPDVPTAAGPGARPWGDRPLVDRVGAIIALAHFVASITVVAVVGRQAWWVNLGAAPTVLGYVGIGLGSAALLLLPRFPRATFVACGLLAFLLYAVGVVLGLPTVLMALVALFGVTLWTDKGSGLWALAAALGSLGLATALLFVRYGYFLPPLETFFGDRAAVFLFNSSAVVLLTWAVADQVRTARERRSLQHEAQAHAAESAAHQLAERAAVSRADALADRQRIAREMHDVVAHGLSVMIVQADGARFAAAADPEVATNALATIAATGRSSLAEMRRLLGVLRDEESTAPGAPQPGLADVEGLVARLVDGGRRVHLRFAGDPPPAQEDEPGSATGLTAYRIVQEALTNVMKHAGDDATAWVTLTVHTAGVVVEVVDDGSGGNGDSPTTRVEPGHGLRGMAERVEMLGGSLVTGPDPRGGFRVVATLPRTTPEVTRPIEVTP
ncbi:histidine kinase [Terrabacter sp. 2RAF25]|uniref:ATP-binding protein n=1 Tax=Terrabacter sp. 2RAF25 TaxID=3232998 RepID=UPI003F9EA2C2